MDITGARWGLGGAEAILTLRAVIANRDFDDYWTFHLDQERLNKCDARDMIVVVVSLAAGGS